jgi:Phytoene/squalene synthetase
MPPEISSATGYAPRGTAWYYATLHLPPQQRLPLLALQAWWRAVRSIPHTVSDAGVASAKLAWWEVQVGLCRDGRPEHPLLLALQPALHAAHVAPEPMLRALAQVGETLRQSRWLDWRGLQRHLEEGPGQIARVACHISGLATTHSHDLDLGLDYAGALGVALAQVGLVRDVGRDVRRGWFFSPLTTLPRMT